MDGVDGGDSGVLVLRDGTIRGGTSFFYLIGTYSCSNGRWKGEMTSQEHFQAPATRPMARRIVSIGFSGTYTALVGKRSTRDFRSTSINRHRHRPSACLKGANKRLMHYSIASFIRSPRRRGRAALLVS